MRLNRRSPAVSVAGVVARIPLMRPAIVMMLRRGRRVILMLRRRARGHNARRLGVVAAGAARPQRLGTVVKVIRDRGSLHHEVEDRRTAHHLDGPLEWQIGEPLPVAPDYHVARLQTRSSCGSPFPRALNVYIFFCVFLDKFNFPLPLPLPPDRAYCASSASKRQIPNIKICIRILFHSISQVILCYSIRVSFDLDISLFLNLLIKFIN